MLPSWSRQTRVAARLPDVLMRLRRYCLLEIASDVALAAFISGAGKRYLPSEVITPQCMMETGASGSYQLPRTTSAFCLIPHSVVGAKPKVRQCA